MRLKLIISGEEIDTFSDQSLLLTREIYTKENVASTDIAYSQQISIPASERNQRIFDYIHLLDYWEKPNPHMPYNGIASLEDGQDLKCIVEIRGFTKERGVIKTYQIAFYVFAPELFSRFSTDNLADVDFSALDFDLTQANVMASWEVGGTDYFCPVMAHSKPFYYLTDTPASPVPGDIAHDWTGVELADCKPSYLLTRIVEILFAHYGVTITWDEKAAAHLAEAFILPSKAAGGLAYTVDATNFYFSGERRTDHQFPDPPAWEVINIETELSDVGDHYYDQKYHVTQAGGYSCAVSINQRYNANINIGYRVNGGAWNGLIYLGKLITAHFYVNANAGDYIEFGVEGSVINPLAPNRLEGATVEVKLSESFFYQQTVQAALQMPEMKVSEFIKGFLEGFKLTMLQTGVNSYKIYDNRSIYKDGTTRDWTNYVDARVLAYQKRDAFKRLVLKHQTGEDNYNVQFAAYSGRQFGAVNYDTGLTFGTNEITVESIFSVFPPVFLGQQTEAGEASVDPTSLLLHQQLNGEGEPVASKFLLFYRNGVDGVSHPYWLQDGVNAAGATFSQIDTFGFYSTNQELPCAADTPTLCYGMENPPAGEYSQACLAYVFWRDTLEVFINNAAYQLGGIPFRVPASEMAAFKINDTILVDGIYHIPVKAVYDYVHDVLKLDLLIYHPTVAPTLPAIARGTGEFTNAVDVKPEIMHTLGGRRSGDRIFKTTVPNLWKARKLT